MRSPADVVIGADETYWRLMMKGNTKKWWM